MSLHQSPRQGEFNQSPLTGDCKFSSPMLIVILKGCGSSSSCSSGGSSSSCPIFLTTHILLPYVPSRPCCKAKSLHNKSLRSSLICFFMYCLNCQSRALTLYSSSFSPSITPFSPFSML